MNLKEFLKPTKTTTIFFIILLLFIPFLPLISVNVPLQCLIPPCGYWPMLVYLYSFLFDKPDYTATGVWHVSLLNPVVMILLMYFISALLSFGLKNHKSETSGILIALIGFAIFYSGFQLLINPYRYYYRENDYLALTIALVGLIVAGIGVYKFFKKSENKKEISI